MRYSWTEEQTLLRETMGRYVAAVYPFEQRAARVERGFDRGSWRGLAELGALAVTLPEEVGGMGGGLLETAIVAEAMGRGLVVEPFVAAIVLGAGLVQRAGSAALLAKWIPQIAAGERVIAFAFAEPRSRYNLAHVETRAGQKGGGYVVSGRKAVVLGGGDADALIVSVRTGGDVADRFGISLLLVDPRSPGVAMRGYTTVDGHAAAELMLCEVEVGADMVLGKEGQALSHIEHVVDSAAVAVSAEAVGAMESLNARCRDYLKTRVAFGKPIADFQVVQHRLVDMELAYHQAAAAVLRAATLDHLESSERARAVSACKYQVGQEASFVAKQAVQLHGAIGMTDELDVGHYFKRIMAIVASFGSGDHHLRRYLDLRRPDGDR